MKRERTAAKTTLLGAMGIAAAGLLAGLAHADPPLPTPPPRPTPAPGNGPGANMGPTQPGHDGPIPQDAVVPMWAPPAPPPPFWAPWLPVVWNTDFNAWGVWWNGDFQTLP